MVDVRGPARPEGVTCMLPRAMRVKRMGKYPPPSLSMDKLVKMEQRSRCPPTKFEIAEYEEYQLLRGKNADKDASMSREKQLQFIDRQIEQFSVFKTHRTDGKAKQNGAGKMTVRRSKKKSSRPIFEPLTHKTVNVQAHSIDTWIEEIKDTNPALAMQMAPLSKRGWTVPADTQSGKERQQNKVSKHMKRFKLTPMFSLDNHPMFRGTAGKKHRDRHNRHQICPSMSHKQLNSRIGAAVEDSVLQTNEKKILEQKRMVPSLGPLLANSSAIESASPLVTPDSENKSIKMGQSHEPDCIPTSKPVHFTVKGNRTALQISLGYVRKTTRGSAAQKQTLRMAVLHSTLRTKETYCFEPTETLLEAVEKIESGRCVPYPESISVVLKWAYKTSPLASNHDRNVEAAHEIATERRPIYTTIISLLNSCSKPSNFFYYSFDKEGAVDLRKVLVESSSEEDDSTDDDY